MRNRRRPAAAALVLLAFSGGGGMAPVRAAPGPVLGDHSSAAIELFHNLRTPSALLAGMAVPLGLLSPQPPLPPPPEATDAEIDAGIRALRTHRVHLFLATATVLNHLLSMTYSTVAINNLAGIRLPATASAGELISVHFEQSWLGANVHFLAGLVGVLGLLVTRSLLVYPPIFGTAYAKVAAAWPLAAVLFAVGVVDRGIALGPDSAAAAPLGAFGVSSSGAWSPSLLAERFRRSFAYLCLRYARLVVSKSLTGSVLPAAALGLMGWSVVRLAADFWGFGRDGEFGDGDGDTAATPAPAASSAGSALESEEASLPRASDGGGLFGFGGSRDPEEDADEEPVQIPNWR